MHCTSTQPSRVRYASDGACVWLRLSDATRSGCATACSISAALAMVSAEARSDDRTCCPAPVCARTITAASVPTVAASAVVKSTYGQ